MDFLVITPFHVVVVECENMVGDIEIDETGGFVRRLGARGTGARGICSPVEQNGRHVEALRHGHRSKSGLVLSRLQRLVLESCCQSIVVLANPKGVIDADRAPKEARDRVIRVDRLVSWVKALDAR